MIRSIFTIGDAPIGLHVVAPTVIRGDVDKGSCNSVARMQWLKDVGAEIDLREGEGARREARTKREQGEEFAGTGKELCEASAGEKRPH